jgi:hypothetical protein
VTTPPFEVSLIPKTGVHNSSHMAGQKNVLGTFMGQNLCVFTRTQIFFMKETRFINKKLDLVGHIWPAGRMLCMPVQEDHMLSIVQTSNF